MFRLYDLEVTGVLLCCKCIKCFCIICHWLETYIEPDHEKTCFMSYANNKGKGQPAHPRSLIGVFVVRCLDSIIPILAISLASVCG